MNIKEILNYTEKEMSNILEHLKKRFLEIQINKINPDFFNKFQINCYNKKIFLNKISNISIYDKMTLVISSWDKSILPLIEKSIMDSKLDFIIINKNDSLFIKIPVMTENRRKEIVKIIKKETENTKISIRNIRKYSNNHLKDIKESDKDIIKKTENKIQIFTNNYIKNIDSIFLNKKNEIMKI